MTFNNIYGMLGLLSHLFELWSLWTLLTHYQLGNVLRLVITKASYSCQLGNIPIEFRLCEKNRKLQ